MNLIQKINSLECAVEYWIDAQMINEKLLFEILMIFEIFKLPLKIKSLVELGYHDSRSELEQISNKQEQSDDIGQILEKIKNKQYKENIKQQEEINGKKYNLFDNFIQKENQLSYSQFKIEIIYILRPFIHCILLRLFGSNSFKHYSFNILVDLYRIKKQIDLNIDQKLQIEYLYRNQKLLINYLLRQPLREKLMKIIQPFLMKIFRFQTLIQMINYLIKMRSFYTLIM